MKNTEGVPRGRGFVAPESEYPMVLLCVSVCKHSDYRITILGTLFQPHENTASTPREHCFDTIRTLLVINNNEDRDSLFLRLPLVAAPRFDIGESGAKDSLLGLMVRGSRNSLNVA